MSLQKIEGRYGVISDEGYRIDRTGSPITQFVMRYHEDGKMALYYMENLMPWATDRISVSGVNGWEPPHAQEQMSLEKKRQIALRIKEAMFFLGDRAIVVD